MLKQVNVLVKKTGMQKKNMKAIQAGLSTGKEAITQRCSVKKGALRNFAKFTVKHCESQSQHCDRSQSLFFNRVAGSALQLY